MFHSFHGLMNSINWPASSIWVSIAQLVEHCSAKCRGHRFESRGSPERLFFRLFSQLLKLRFTAMVTYSFQNNNLIIRGHPDIQWNPNFSNPQFLKPPDFSNQFLFPLDILLCNFIPDFSNLLIS